MDSSLFSYLKYLSKFYLDTTYWNYWGGYSSSFSFIIMSSLAFIVSKKFLWFKIDIVFISKIILASILMALIVFLLNEQISLTLQILIGIVTYFVLCYAFKIFNKEELSFFKNIIRLPKHSN